MRWRSCVKERNTYALSFSVYNVSAGVCNVAASISLHMQLFALNMREICIVQYLNATI